MRTLKWTAGVLALTTVLGIGGCAAPTAPEATGLVAKRDNELLNGGYSLLYSAVSGLRFSDDLLLVKFESERLNKVIKDVSTTADKMRSDLQRIAKDYPAVQIDRQPLPAIEVETRNAVNKDRLLSIAPVVGQSGPAFERTLLLSSSGALDQTRFLCQVMAESEPDPNLKRFLLDSEKQFARLYDQVVLLLNQVHFKQDPAKRP